MSGVLDSKLLLCRESQLDDIERKLVASLDGSETVVLGAGLGETYRVLSRRKCPSIEALSAEESRLDGSDFQGDKLSPWRRAIRRHPNSKRCSNRSRFRRRPRR